MVTNDKLNIKVWGCTSIILKSLLLQRLMLVQGFTHLPQLWGSLSSSLRHRHSLRSPHLYASGTNSTASSLSMHRGRTVINGSQTVDWNLEGDAPVYYVSPESVAPEVTHWTEMMRVGWTDETTSKNTKWDDVLSDFDVQQIETYWDELMPLVSYLGTDAVAKVYRALCVAYRAHRGQLRKSGEPFIIHPVQVAVLLSELKMDAETVMAGLLHDTVEDTDLTFHQVEKLFGHTVRSIVEGETKVSKLPKLAFSEYADEQAENLRQMFVAMTSDYRIIIVKLADRLHNMRTLRHMKPEKQIKISRETLDIFAPVSKLLTHVATCERLG